MLLLFYVGSFWQDSGPVREVAVSGDDAVNNCKRYGVIFPVALVVSLVIWPFMTDSMLSRQARHVEIPPSLMNLVNSGFVSPPDWEWQPEFDGIVVDAHHYVKDGDAVVAMYFANFGDESRGGELINSQNLLVRKKHKAWRVILDAKMPVAWPTQTADVEESVLSGNSRDLLVLRWYRIGQTNTANAYHAKWLQLLKRLSGDASPELMVVLYTETPHNDYQQARERLKKIALTCCG